MVPPTCNVKQVVDSVVVSSLTTPKKGGMRAYLKHDVGHVEFCIGLGLKRKTGVLESSTHCHPVICSIESW